MTLPHAFLARPIAHRALHDIRAGRPENSRAAMRAAIDKGYGIECDLRLSADGVPMVFHDEHLMRLAGVEGTVAERTAEELGRMSLRHGDEGVPTLAEMLDLVGGRVPLLIEIKDRTGLMAAVDGVLEEATVRALKGYEGPVAFMSFNPQSVIALRDLAPDLPRGIVTSAYDPRDPEWALIPEGRRDRLREIADYETADACFISHEAVDLARPRVAELKAQGAKILCWTIKSPEAEAQARQVADNVTFEGYLA